MRKFALLLFCLLPFMVFAQDYSGVVQVPGKSADELYASAREWFALTFKSANDVLQMDDPVAGKLIGKGSFHASDSYSMNMGIVTTLLKTDWYPSFTITIAVREGRYKYDITNIVIKELHEGSQIPPTEFPFDSQNKDYWYKNGTDPVSFSNNVEGADKLSKKMRENNMKVFKSKYDLTVATEEKFTEILASLQQKMNEIDDDW